MKYKILIIDDEEMILSMMKKCLQEKFSVYTADSAKKALELLEDVKPKFKNNKKKRYSLIRKGW